MAAKRKRIPRYSKVQINGHEYYKTDIEDADGKRVILYGKTREEVYDKEMAALEQIDNATFRRKSPTVAEYCEKCPAAGQWQNTVRSRACRICTLPVLAAALCTGFDERPELGRTGCLAGDLCRTGPLLRGRHWRSVRYSLLERGELTKMLALCWRNCRKAGNERN